MGVPLLESAIRRAYRLRMACSVRPGRRSAILCHLLPNSPTDRAIVSSSLRVQLTRSGLSSASEAVSLPFGFTLTAAEDLAAFPLPVRPLPVAPDADIRNVKVQSGDEKSMLSLVKQLIALRKAEADLSVGDFKVISAENEVLVFARGDKHCIALNFSGEERAVDASGTIALNTALDRKGESVEGTLTLRANEGVILAA